MWLLYRWFYAALGIDLLGCYGGNDLMDISITGCHQWELLQNPSIRYTTEHWRERG